MDRSINFYKQQLNLLSTTVLYDKSYGNAFIIEENLINYLPSKKIIGKCIVVEVENSILPIIEALSQAKPGYVLVVNNVVKGDQALLGDIIMTAAKTQNISGIVVFGYIRDVDSIPKIIAK